MAKFEQKSLIEDGFNEMYSEEKVFEHIEKKVKDAIINTNCPDCDFSFNELKSLSNIVKSVSVYGRKLFTVYVGFKKNKKIRIKIDSQDIYSQKLLSSLLDEYLNDSVKCVLKQNSTFYGYEIEMEENLSTLDYFLDVLEPYIEDRYIRCWSVQAPDSFGCCSHYEECSNAKKCVLEDKEFIKRCIYRKRLFEGKVFYGKNRNV